MHGTPILCPLTPKCWMLQRKPHDLSGTSEHVLQDCNILIITLEKSSIRGSCFASIVRQQRNNFFKYPSQFKLGKLNSQYQSCPQHTNIVMHACTCAHMHTYLCVHMCVCIYMSLYMHIYKYVFYIYVYTHIILCMLLVSLLRMVSISAQPSPSEKTIRLWASFPEMCIYFVLCNSTGQSPTSRVAFVVEILHPVTVKSC